MRVFIAGIDGYLGWPLAQYLAARGHVVGGLDALFRRKWVAEIGGISAMPIFDFEERRAAFFERYNFPLAFWNANLLDFASLCESLETFQPDAVVHLGEMPSAAYSMIDAAHAAYTQQNNVIGNLNLLWAMKETCPSAHLIKLGTMGEYGTPNLDIPEGFFEIEFRGRKDILPFPRQAGSFYHLSKVHDSHNTMLACKIWGLRSTDIMQGVVFGTQIDEMGDDLRLRSRLDYDQCFGTVINRFCCQAVIDYPITVYGLGSQTRSVLPLRDAMQCLALVVENPPEAGEYRVFNQFQECFTIDELACLVREVGAKSGLQVEIQHFDNPRQEAETHYYNPDRDRLDALGYRASHSAAVEVEIMLRDLMQYKSRIRTCLDSLLPDIRWDGLRQRSQALQGEKTE